MLNRLERDGPATVTALAWGEGVRPQYMGATVSGLEAAQLVRGTPDPTDGRQTASSLTAGCRKMIKAARAARAERLSRTIRGKLAPAEHERLAAAVELLKRLIDA